VIGFSQTGGVQGAQAADIEKSRQRGWIDPGGNHQPGLKAGPKNQHV
jgi:hypothetical protein